MNIESFYKELSEKLGIAPLHLDAILWLNHTEIMEQIGAKDSPEIHDESKEKIGKVVLEDF